MVVDMGLHLLTGLPEAQQLHQVLVPGLQERARRLPPLQSAQQLSPGEQADMSTSGHNIRTRAGVLRYIVS